MQFSARLGRRTAILPNRVPCGHPLWHTACRVHWESDDARLNCRFHCFTKRESVILRPRVVLRANSKCGLQDLPRQEARSSWEPKSVAQIFLETGCDIVDYRVSGMSLSTVQQQDEQWQHTVAKLIEMFESHQHKEQFLKDMSQTQKFNRFSEASQKLQQDMDQTEIFELCERSTKLQCSDCNSFTEIGIIYCSCWRNLKYKRSPTTNQKENNDYTSTPGYIIKKNSGQSERQINVFKAKEMLEKARQSKHGGHPMNLARWYAQEGYRRSLAEHNIGVKEIMFYDQIALENHDYIATEAERIQNSKHWVLSTNADGRQLPRQQRPDYAAAKRECQRLQDEYMAETKQLYKPVYPSKQMRQDPNQQFEGSEDYDYIVDRNTGWKWYIKSSRKTCRILRLRRPDHGRIPRDKIGIHGGGILQSLMKGSEWLFKTCSFGLPERGTDNSTESVHRIHTRCAHHEQYSLLTSTNMWCVLVAPELNGSSRIVASLCAWKESVIQSAMSSPCWSLPHLLTSSPAQHEAPSGQHDLLQDDTVHRAPLPEPIQSTSLARQLREWQNPAQHLSHIKKTRATLGQMRPLDRETPSSWRSQQQLKTAGTSTCLMPSQRTSSQTASRDYCFWWCHTKIRFLGRNQDKCLLQLVRSTGRETLDVLGASTARKCLRLLAWSQGWSQASTICEHHTSHVVFSQWITCKDNTSKDPFSRCEICNNLGYRMSGRSQRQEHHWRHEAQDQHEAQHETQQCVQRLKNTWGTREHARSVAVFVVSLCFCCCHTHPLHIAHWLKMFASHSIPWSSPCRMHELSVLSDFLDLFIYFIFLLFFILNLQHFLLPFNFPEVK